MNFGLIRSFTTFLIILSVVLCISTKASAIVMARGDGFVIDSSDIDAQRAFFSEKGFESTDAEYLNSVLRVRLFVLEAKNSGLIDSLPESSGPQKYGETEEYYKYFLFYYQHLMETYPVSDDAVLSYYYSYPEKFLQNTEGPKEDIKKEDLVALDDSTKTWIRNQIVLSKKAVIVEDEFDRLKKKYHVVYEK